MGLVIDSLKGLLDHNHIEVVASDPIAAEDGEMIINESDNGLKIWYGGAWQTIFVLSGYEFQLLLEDGDIFITEDGDELRQE